MSDNDKNNIVPINTDGDIEKEEHFVDGRSVKYISGMYENWFLDYASYVILERAVPYLDDGLKPVQRRILHSMKRMDDGRYNKVANIIGHTMQFHPHGDASIGDALVQLGQKELLIDTQGNWGNILTGDNAAAPRYIEARLTKFALEVLFNPKTTEWKPSYDGRNKEPVCLPVKFPLLLAQGVEGIAVGLASKILPHNFIELIDASILYLKGKPFEIYPDFPTGGMAEIKRYNDGLRGGKVRVRAKITKLDRKTLVITEIPYGKTTSSLIDSVLSANEKGKIKIKKIDDNTAENVEILIHLPNDAYPDMVIDALYAFTDCEISISPNACIIENDKPRFIGVSQMLKESTDNTVQLLKRELEIRLNELDEDWHLSSLEKIFIENRIYRDIEECETFDDIIVTIDKGLEPFKKLLRREITRDDIVRLTEIRIKRISKYDGFKADEHIKSVEEEIEKVKFHLNNLIDYTIDYFKDIKKKYSKGHERRTELRNFDVIEATQVVANNVKLYVNREGGFVGTSLKKDEFVGDCSDIDDVIVFLRDGKYIVVKVTEKTFIGKNIIHVAVFKRNDERTIYNVIYLEGKSGQTLMKRFNVTSVTRDRQYDVTLGEPHSRILYFSANPNGESEILKVILKPRPRVRRLVFDVDMAEVSIKGRNSKGNILTKYPIHKIHLKEKGHSTLGGMKLWFDFEILRLNSDEKGEYLGEFKGEDKILVFMKKGTYKLIPFDLNIHFEDDTYLIEKYVPNKVFSAAFYDADQQFSYIKRFEIEDTLAEQSIIGDNPDSQLYLLSDDSHPRFEAFFGGKDKNREPLIVDVHEFIGVKSHKARGKRISTYKVSKVNRLEPLISEEKLNEFINEQEKSNNDVNNNNSGDPIQGELF